MCVEQRSIAMICWKNRIARPQRRGLVSLSIKIYPSCAARRDHSVRVVIASDDAGQLSGEDGDAQDTAERAERAHFEEYLENPEKLIY